MIGRLINGREPKYLDYRQESSAYAAKQDCQPLRLVGVLRTMFSMQFAALRRALRTKVIMAHWAVLAAVLSAALCKTLLRTTFVLVRHSEPGVRARAG